MMMGIMSNVNTWLGGNMWGTDQQREPCIDFHEFETVLEEYCIWSFLYGPRYARSIAERTWVIFSKCSPHARLIRRTCK